MLMYLGRMVAAWSDSGAAREAAVEWWSAVQQMWSSGRATQRSSSRVAVEQCREAAEEWQWSRAKKQQRTSDKSLHVPSMSQWCGPGVVAEQQWSITNKSSVAAVEQNHKQQRMSSGGGREGAAMEEGKEK